MFSIKFDLKQKIILACLCANALIFYNFTLCGVYIGTLSKLFFPSESSFSTLLGGIIVFSAAFVTRPLGALVFGYIGDRFGRKKALTLSKILAGLPMLIIALLPTYESIGIAAPSLLLLCRLLQGICTGGGYNGAGVFMLEHAKRRPGLISGFLSASCVVGALAATLSAVLVNHFSGVEWGWRIPFFLGVGIIFVSFYIKKIAGETEDFAAKKTIRSSPFVELIKKYPKQYMLAVLTGVLNGLLSYTLFGFLNIYLSTYIGVQFSSSLVYNLVGLISFMVSCLVFGHLYDLESIKKQQPLFLSALVVMGASWLGFLFIQEKQVIFMFLGQACLGIGVGAFVGPSHAFLQEQFLPEVRYTGIASGFSLGMALSGSTTLLLMNFMLNRFEYLMAPAVVLLITTCVWFEAYKSMKAEVINN